MPSTDGSPITEATNPAPVAKPVSRRCLCCRLPEAVREFHRDVDVRSMVVAPLRLGERMFGWINLCSCGTEDREGAQWWRVVLTEAMARQAALALHHNRVVEQSRVERVIGSLPPPLMQKVDAALRASLGL